MYPDRCFCVYMMASASGIIYTGSTSNLLRRVYQHKHAIIPGFTAAYAVTRLVYYDCTRNSRAAVEREREIKKWRREKKVALIEAANPGWIDLAAGWFPDPPGQDPSLRSG